MKKTRNMLLTAFALFAAVAMTTSTAEAGRFGISLNFGGHRHYSGYGNRGYSQRGYGQRNYGYRSYGRRSHNTSHWDYHPGGFQRHGNHYHYIPGHYHWHNDGHWDHH